MLFYLLSNSNYITDDENKLVRIIIIGSILYLLIHGIVIADTKLNKYFWFIVSLDIGSMYLLSNNVDLNVSKGGNHNLPLNFQLPQPLFNKEDDEKKDDNELIDEILNSEEATNTDIKEINDEIDYSDFEKNL
jgi:hypothetical protein